MKWQADSRPRGGFAPRYHLVVMLLLGDALAAVATALALLRNWSRLTVP